MYLSSIIYRERDNGAMYTRDGLLTIVESLSQYQSVIMNIVRNKCPIIWWFFISHSLQWRHNGRDTVSNHQPHDFLLKRLFRLRSKKTSKLHVTGLCAGNSPGTGEFPAQMANDAENVSIWWCHHIMYNHKVCDYIVLFIRSQADISGPLL